MNTSMRRQKGMALVVAMIMLIMMTLMAISTFNLSRSSLQVISNMQENQETVNMANVAIAEALSTTRLFQSPGAIWPNPCDGPNTRCFDSNGDGQTDVTVQITPTPTCIQARAVPNSTLDWELASDRGCIVGETQNFGIIGSGLNALCSNSIWEVNALATDNLTGAQVLVTQGAAVRVSSNNIELFCPLP